MLSFRTTVICLLCGLCFTTEYTNGAEDLKAYLQRKIDDAEKYFEKGDFQSITQKLYASDIRFMGPEHKAIKSRPGVKQYISKYRKGNVRKMEHKNIEYFGSWGDDYVIASGDLNLKDAKDRVVDDGKFVAIWKKTGDEYFVQILMVNYDTPDHPR